MKNLLLLIALIFIGPELFSQTDVIYPLEGDSIIRDCKIKDIYNGNIVHYVKNSETEVIAAVAIVRNGSYKNLIGDEPTNNNLNQNPIIENPQGQYNGHDYNYYNKKYRKARGQANVGAMMTLLGAGFSAYGYSLLLDDDSNNDVAGQIGFFSGVVLFNVGLPLWISGGIKKGNNKRAREKAQQAGSLSFGLTNNGIGFTLNL